MKKQVIEAPPLKAVGPYSIGVAAGDYVFFSGQIPIDPDTGKLVADEIKLQTVQVFKNLNVALAAAGLKLADVVKVTVFLTNMADFAAMNEIYAAHFEAPFPARSTIGVAALPLGARVEIEITALAPPDDWPTRLT